MDATKLMNLSISQATMRPEDLIPAFISTLRIIAVDDVNQSILATLHEIEISTNEAGYYESENAQFDLDYLCDTLNIYAPDNYYFGSHPGDGSDFGFWECEDNEDN